MDTTTIILLSVVAVVLLLGLFFFARRGGGPESQTPLTTRPGKTGRLGSTASALGVSLKRAWGQGLDDQTWDEIEEALLAADVGLDASADVVKAVKTAKPETVAEARGQLGVELKSQLEDVDRGLFLTGHPSVVLVVGVNGTGKTTTIAKLANRLTGQGNLVLLAAADTFRAAAGTQLQSWGDRLGVTVVGGQEGGDPASVAFDAIESARAKGADVVIVDTAGRLHGKRNMMDELTKIHRISAGERGEVDEVLLVLDATGGQNGIEQVKQFSDAVPVTGIVLTKLDGTAKGGIVIAVERELGVPVKFVGLGEGIDDLEPFDPNNFVEELLEQS
jgi:fused signal recognition particle receptor